MTILITGATGLVGTALIQNLKGRGHQIRFLTTSEAKINAIDGAKGYYWNPERGEIDERSVKGVGTLVHLAGATIGKRWTDSYKIEIIRSRVKSAELLYGAAAKSAGELKHFVSASGIGIYPNSLSERYDEHFSGKAKGFPAQVVREWEKAADAFALLGSAVSKVRTGLVLAKEGGALSELVKPVRLGFGAPLGSGKQIVSWIHLDDLVRIYTLVIEKQLAGTFNAVAPGPVSQSQLNAAIAKVLEKPLWLPKIPSGLLKLGLGEMSALLLEGQFVESHLIVSEGMVFKYPDIDMALRDLLA